MVLSLLFFIVFAFCLYIFEILYIHVQIFWKNPECKTSTTAAQNMNSHAMGLMLVIKSSTIMVT